MPPKGGNAKKESGRAKKAENEEKKKESASEEKARKEAAEWADGAKVNKNDKEEKRKAEIARKAEAARLLAEEEAANTAVKPKAAAPKGGKKSVKETKPAGPGAIAAGELVVENTGGNTSKEKEKGVEDEEVEEFHATGIDNALDLLEVVTAKMDKASVGQQAAGIEKHPERRFKAALEAYQERELPQLKIDQPGLRLQQYKDILYKSFQKSPDNPFNQTTISYDATKDEKIQALNAKRNQTEQRLKV